MKVHGRKYTCRSCQNVNMLLYRHLDSFAESFAGMSADDVASFFQEAAALPDPGDKGKWKIIRALYVEKQTVRMEKQQTEKLKGEWLPMNVWENRGWSKEQVLAYDRVEETGPVTLY